MIINYNTYRCKKCRKFQDFDSTTKYDPICPNCNIKLDYFGNWDSDTDLIGRTVPEATPEMYFQYLKEQNTPKCPTCQSTNLKKISGTKRFLSVGVLGLASSNVGKSFECLSCGYKW